MFAIYNVEGRRFRDSLEKLKKVRRASPVERVDIHADTAQDETFVIQGVDPSAFSASQKGVAAYKETFENQHRERIIHAYQVMSHPVMTLPLSITLEKAYLFFKEHRIEQAPVINLQNKLVGILALKDLLNVMMIENHEIHAVMDNKTIADIMEEDVITADPVSDIRRVADVLVTYRLSGLPVVNEHDDLVGIISRSDLLKAMTQDPPLSIWS